MGTRSVLFLIIIITMGILLECNCRLDLRWNYLSLVSFHLNLRFWSVSEIIVEIFANWTYKLIDVLLSCYDYLLDFEQIVWKILIAKFYNHVTLQFSINRVYELNFVFMLLLFHTVFFSFLYFAFITNLTELRNSNLLTLRNQYVRKS